MRVSTIYDNKTIMVPETTMEYYALRFLGFFAGDWERCLGGPYFRALVVTREDSQNGRMGLLPWRETIKPLGYVDSVPSCYANEINQLAVYLDGLTHSVCIPLTRTEKDFSPVTSIEFVIPDGAEGRVEALQRKFQADIGVEYDCTFTINKRYFNTAGINPEVVMHNVVSFHFEIDDKMDFKKALRGVSLWATSMLHSGLTKTL